MRMDETIGKLEQDNLIFDTTHPIDVKSITLVGGKNFIKRGTLINSNGEVWSGKSNEIADCILCDDIDTGTTGGSSMVVAAYRSGHFIRQSIIVAEGKTLSPEAETQLRNNGIFLSNAVLI